MSKGLAHLTVARDSVFSLLKTNHEDLCVGDNKSLLDFSAKYWYKHGHKADSLIANLCGKPADVETQGEVENPVVEQRNKD